MATSDERRATERPDDPIDDLDEIERHLKVLERSAPIARAGFDPKLRDLERAALNKFLAWLAPRGVPTGADVRQRLEPDARRIVGEAARGIDPPPTPADLDRAARNIVLDVVGNGPIQELLDDPSVTEVMINGPGVVLVEREGRIERTNVRFRDAEHLTSVLRRVAERIDRRIDFQHPMLDAKLMDGSRVHAIIPPIAIDGPVMTIRKYRPIFRQIEDLVQIESLTPEMAFYLGAAVKARCNIAIGGPSAAGKTTTLNVLASQVPMNERVVTIEELAELDLTNAHAQIVRLQSRTENTEGAGEVTIRRLIREALRMRAERIVVGEARGAEMLDVLQAMRCGHDGSMTTIHATSEHDLVERAVTISMFGNVGFEEASLRRMVYDALDVIILLTRFADGSRKIVKISEPFRDLRTGEVRFNELFSYDHEGYVNGRSKGRFRTLGVTRFLERFRLAGIDLPRDTFAGAEGR